MCNKIKKKSRSGSCYKVAKLDQTWLNQIHEKKRFNNFGTRHRKKLDTLKKKK